jgi:membrane-associated protease RseP (regulator of RpoE activity)
MLEFVGIVILLTFVALSIGLHEVGHMLPAKKFGVKVPDYSIGMGPRLFRWTRGETTYNIRLLPIGGFVRLVGMFPPARESDALKTGRLAEMMQNAREDSLSEVEPGEEHRTFYSKPVWQRLIIMLGGPFMNLIIASILFTAILVGLGLPQNSTTIGSVVTCVPTQSDPEGAGTVAGCGVAGETPAMALGLVADDTIVSVNGRTITEWSDIATALKGAAAGDVVELVVRRIDGTTLRESVALADLSYPELDETGTPTGVTLHRPFFGVTPGVEWVQQPVSVVPRAMWNMTVRSFDALGAFPAKLLGLGQNLFSSAPRDPEGPISVVGVTRISGEIAASDLSIRSKALEILGLAASLNLFLFVFNLLPVLPLDGGHVAAASYEGVRRRINRLRHKADPGPIDTAKLLPLTYAMAAVLLLSGLIVILADIIKPVSLQF